MQPMRLGVIGAGLIWIRTHQPILETLEDTFVPVAFCDFSAPRRAVLKEEYPDVPVFDDYHQLLALPEVDVVLVLTPIALNAPTAEAALRAGKHVIMEKPIARSLAEGRALVDLARQSGYMLCVTEQMAYRQAEITLADIIASGEIGDLVLWDRVMHLEADTAPGPMQYASTAWRKEANFPLGTMFDGGVHLIAGLSKVFGIPETVAATGRKLRPEYGEFDQVAALFQYANGVTGMLSHSSYLSPVQNHFHIYGTAGGIVVEQDKLIVKKTGQPDRTIELPEENASVNMWQAFRQAFRDQREPFYTPEKALNDVATLEAVDRAIKTHERVPVSKA